MNLGTPKPAPFKVGQKLRYLGNGRGTTGGPVINGVYHELATGSVVTVVEANPGWHGSGAYIPKHDCFDETEDGYNVVLWPFNYRTCIHREDRDRWEEVKA